MRALRSKLDIEATPPRTGAPATSGKWADLGKRLGVAVVLLPLVILLLRTGGAACAILFAVGAAIGAAEYMRLTVANEPAAWAGVAVAALLPLLPWALPEHTGSAAFAALVALAMVLWTHFLFAGPRADAPARIGHILTGALFASSGLVALAALRQRPLGLDLTAAVMIATWSNDTGAYLGGKRFGRHKLFPAVSPGKTWEGLGSGFIVGAASLALARGLGVVQLSTVDLAVISVVAGVVGPVGDLCKSLLKRAYGVKDSGRLFPGHGGMLDRIDALLFNAPVVLIYAWLSATSH